MHLLGRFGALCSTAFLAASFAVACGNGESSDGGKGGSGPAPQCPSGTETELTGEINESVTLLAACSPYRVTGTSGVTFFGDGTLVTIEAGVEIIVEEGLDITFDDGARLEAEGTSAARITIHGDGDAGWGTLGLRSATSGTTTHELHYVTVSDAARDALDPERPAVRVLGGGENAPTELFADHLTIEEPGGIGLSLYRDAYTRFADGTTDLVVRDAASFPLALSAQNLATLPELQELSSADAGRNAISVDGGDGGTIVGTHAWAAQDLPFRLTAVGKYSVGSPTDEGALELDAGTTIEFTGAHLEFDNGSIVAAGTMDEPIELVGDGDTGIILDARTSPTSDDSSFENVIFRDVIVELYSMTSGLPGECVDDGPVFTGSTTEGDACLAITGYTEGQFDVECKDSDC